jgi:hypothetical protein
VLTISWRNKWKDAEKKCKVSEKFLTCNANERLQVLITVLQGCYAVDWSIFTDVPKDRGLFFFLRSFSPEGIAVLRIFIIWEYYLFTDMKSVVVGLNTSLHAVFKAFNLKYRFVPKHWYCSV